MRRRLSRLALAVALIAGAALASASSAVTTARVFQLHHISASDAVRVIQPLLSEEGSFMVQPAVSRLTVQDRPEIVARVAELIQIIDRAPNEFRIRVDLYLASNDPLPDAKQAPVDAGVRKMFQYRSFRSVGHARIVGLVGDAAGAELGSGYRILFIAKAADPELPQAQQVRAAGGPAPANGQSLPGGDGRLTLQQLMLLHIKQDATGVERRTQVLRTTMLLAPGQRVILGASPSERAQSALILIVHLEAGEEG